jgi:hypothetical protein
MTAFFTYLAEHLEREECRHDHLYPIDGGGHIELHTANVQM